MNLGQHAGRDGQRRKGSGMNDWNEVIITLLCVILLVGTRGSARGQRPSPYFAAYAIAQTQLTP